MVLKSLTDAQRDGDDIYAVIKGTAATQDGHTNGITVPNGESQKLAIRNALRLRRHRPGIGLLCRGARHRHSRG